MNRSEMDRTLQCVAAGDNAAFEQLYVHTKRGVYAFLFTYFHNVADTEDAMQTVYLKIKTGIAGYRFGTNGSAWILQIAKNHALNELKKKRRMLEMETELSESLDGAVEPTWEAGGVMERMQRLLSEEEQRIVTLHVLWGYKHREIAQTLGCPTGTVTSKYKRAIEKMRKELKEEV